MNKLHFHKMHGLGNDFILIDLFAEPALLDKNRIQFLADRYRGIGCDQVLVISPSSLGDVTCQIYNADGSEAEQCGNGLRCVARFVHEEKYVLKSQLTIATKAGLFPVDIKDYENIRVNMGKPLYQAKPLLLEIEGEQVSLTTVSMGNPHALCRVATVADFPIEPWVKAIESSVLFPQGVNIGFMEILDRKNLRLRTHERGVGETRACGSNASAAVVAGILNDWLDKSAAVQVQQGKLLVEWPDPQQPLFLTGPAARVFSGHLSL